MKNLPYLAGKIWPLHWWIYIQNFPAHALPTGPNSFVFTHIFTENCLHQRSMTPKMGPRSLWKILDPHLLCKYLLLPMTEHFACLGFDFGFGMLVQVAIQHHFQLTPSGDSALLHELVQVDLSRLD